MVSLSISQNLAVTDLSLTPQRIIQSVPALKTVKDFGKGNITTVFKPPLSARMGGYMSNFNDMAPWAPQLSPTSEKLITIQPMTFSQL
jgi:hypothetical protein